MIREKEQEFADNIMTYWRERGYNVQAYPIKHATRDDLRLTRSDICLKEAARYDNVELVPRTGKMPKHFWGGR